MVKKILPGPENQAFSKAIIHNQKYSMEISGQIGLDSDGKLVKGIREQTEQALQNIKEILKEAGWSLNNLIKMKIYLTDMEHYGTVNVAYAKYFKKDYPTRVAVAVKELPLGALIEIEGTAAGDEFEDKDEN